MLREPGQFGNAGLCRKACFDGFEQREEGREWIEDTSVGRRVQKRYRRHVANLALQDMPRALLQVGLH